MTTALPYSTSLLHVCPVATSATTDLYGQWQLYYVAFHMNATQYMSITTFSSYSINGTIMSWQLLLRTLATTANHNRTRNKAHTKHDYINDRQHNPHDYCS